MAEHSALSELAHRPWPIPPHPWSWRQSWRDLLFAHWPVPASQLQPLVPDSLQIQEFDGTAWVGIVPFRMAGVMLRPLPDLPYLSAFPELNVRLYVERDGRPGVWFLSLDAANAVAVWSARRFFHLPYHHAKISISGLPERAKYMCARSSASSGIAFEATYEPFGEPYRSAPGSLEHWLTERYCLYAQSPKGQLFRTEVHHRQWPLQSVTAQITRNDLMAPHGLELAGPPEHLHFSRLIDVVIWSPEAVAS